MRTSGNRRRLRWAIIGAVVLVFTTAGIASAAPPTSPGIEFRSDKDVMYWGTANRISAHSPDLMRFVDLVLAGSQVTTSLDGGPGLAEPATLGWAVGAARLGTTALGGDLTLAVPVDTAPGSYSALATVSLFPID